MTIEIKASTPTQVVLKLATQAQESLQDVSVQIASGNKHTDFSGFAGEGNVERFLFLKESVDKTNTYLTSNEIIKGRTGAQDQAISQLQDIAADVAQLIARRRNAASGSDVRLQIEAGQILNDISGKMNVKYDGRYLFAGTKTNTKPVPNITFSNVDSNNQATASYYSGNSVAPTVKISDTQTLTYGVAGNDVAFQELIGAVHLAMTGDTNDDDEVLQDAMNMIDSAIGKLASVRATVAAAKETIDQTNEVHQDINLLVSENLKDVSQTDIVEATTRMSQLEATVQATFLAFSRLSNLRLTNFLS